MHLDSLEPISLYQLDHGIFLDLHVQGDGYWDRKEGPLTRVTPFGWLGVPNVFPERSLIIERKWNTLYIKSMIGDPKKWANL